MKLSAKIEAKTDETLRQVLRTAAAGQPLRLVMTLGPASDSGGDDAEAPRPKPGEFPTRAKYREAMIEERRAELDRRLGPTMAELEGLGLHLRGGKLGRTVVVDGPAARLVEGLSLPGVRSATLDQAIELIRPKRRGKASSETEGSDR